MSRTTIQVWCHKFLFDSCMTTVCHKNTVGSICCEVVSSMLQLYLSSKRLHSTSSARLGEICELSHVCYYFWNNLELAQLFHKQWLIEWDFPECDTTILCKLDLEAPNKYSECRAYSRFGSLVCSECFRTSFRTAASPASWLYGWSLLLSFVCFLLKQTDFFSSLYYSRIYWKK